MSVGCDEFSVMLPAPFCSALFADELGPTNIFPSSPPVWVAGLTSHEASPRGGEGIDVLHMVGYSFARRVAMHLAKRDGCAGALRRFCYGPAPTG